MALPFCNLVVASSVRIGQRQARAALIKQREYAHDVAKVTIEFDDSSLPQYARGTPVSLQWGWDTSTVNSFAGYVHHAKPQTAHTNTSLLDVYCIGASTSLSERSTQVFTNMTIAGLVRKFAVEHNLATVIADDALYSFDFLPQMNRTGWDLLVWASQQAGLALTCDKTTVYLQPRRINLSNLSPSFRLRPGRADQQNAVYAFEMRDGESTTTPHNVLTAKGIDNQGNDVDLTSAVNNRDTVVRTSASPVARPVTGYTEAVGQIAGQNALERFNISATATISGHAYVRPATSLRLTGVGDSGSRFWWVSEVDHQITLTDYRMDTVLVSDSVPQPTPAVVSQSWSGRPQVFAGGDVVNTLATVPATVYRTNETREAVEVLSPSAYGPTSSSNTASLSPARLLALAQSPTPTRVRGAFSADSGAHTVLPPRYDSWRAESSAAVGRA